MTENSFIRSLFVRETRFYECRRCGHTVDGDAEPCPECGADDVAEYRF